MGVLRAGGHASDRKSHPACILLALNHDQRVSGKHLGKERVVEPRMRAMQANPDVTKPMLAMSQAVHDSGLDPALVMLIDIRASQINGCGQ